MKVIYPNEETRLALKLMEQVLTDAVVAKVTDAKTWKSIWMDIGQCEYDLHLELNFTEGEYRQESIDLYLVADNDRLVDNYLFKGLDFGRYMRLDDYFVAGLIAIIKDFKEQKKSA